MDTYLLPLLVPFPWSQVENSAMWNLPPGLAGTFKYIWLHTAVTSVSPCHLYSRCLPANAVSFQGSQWDAALTTAAGEGTWVSKLGDASERLGRPGSWVQGPPRGRVRSTDHCLLVPPTPPLEL